MGGVGGRTTNGGDISGVGDAGGGGVGGLATADGGGDGDVSGLLEIDVATGDSGAGTWLPPPVALPPARALGKENTPTDAIGSTPSRFLSKVKY